ncbi:MAG: helix-turn-helix transcriptional regulator [Gloeobacteraceae cyanobacterium ES-bin-316]|nr:helix-turn-helix transcriptional regulator [Ferruginibacter sp.]
MPVQAFASKKKVVITKQKKVAYKELCPVRDVLDYIGDKWSMLIVLQLGSHSPSRFGELKTIVAGISQKMLTITLRQLEHDGFVQRVYFPEVPPRVEYSITPLGNSLVKALSELVKWADDNTVAILEARKKSNRISAG